MTEDSAINLLSLQLPKLRLPPMAEGSASNLLSLQLPKLRFPPKKSESSYITTPRARDTLEHNRQRHHHQSSRSSASAMLMEHLRVCISPTTSTFSHRHVPPPVPQGQRPEYLAYPREVAVSLQAARASAAVMLAAAAKAESYHIP